MLFTINKLLFPGKWSMFMKGEIFTKQPNYIHITHYKKKRWICLLQYTSLYFLNSLLRNMYQCYKKKKENTSSSPQKILFLVLTQYPLVHRKSSSHFTQVTTIRSMTFQRLTLKRTGGKTNRNHPNPSVPFVKHLVHTVTQLEQNPSRRHYC